MRSVLFIVKSNIDNTALASSNYMPPLGLLSIANTLRFHGYRVEILDFSARFYQTEEIDALIEEIKPVYIGFSVYTENVDSVFQVCRHMKQRHPGIPLVLGGAHPTMDPDYCKRKRLVDFILQGDGEHSALELAEAICTDQKLISYQEIQGLIYLNEKREYQEGEPKRFILDMDLLPIINRDYLPDSFRAGLPTIYSSRGCPGKCIYCAAPAMSGSHYRVRDMENVFLETLYTVETCEDYQEIFYCDDTFTVFGDRLQRFIQLCRESRVSFRWRCESRVDALYRYQYLLPKLREAGCCRIQFGIESGNQEVLNKIRKGLVLAKAYELIDLTIQAGIPVAASFIFGHYCDTPKTMEETLQMMTSLRDKYGPMFSIAHSLNTPFPGTYQYEHKEELGIEMLSHQFSDLSMTGPAMRTANFDEEDLKRFHAAAIQLYQERTA